MDATQGSADERAAESDRTIATSQDDDTQRTTVRRLAWMLAWGVSLIALIVGISLTATGEIAQSMAAGEDYVMPITVWPAGLVLLGVGALGLIAGGITSAVLTTRR